MWMTFTIIHRNQTRDILFSSSNVCQMCITDQNTALESLRTCRGPPCDADQLVWCSDLGRHQECLGGLGEVLYLHLLLCTPTSNERHNQWAGRRANTYTLGTDRHMTGCRHPEACLRCHPGICCTCTIYALPIEVLTTITAAKNTLALQTALRLHHGTRGLAASHHASVLRAHRVLGSKREAPRLCVCVLLHRLTVHARCCENHQEP